MVVTTGLAVTKSGDGRVPADSIRRVTRIISASCLNPPYISQNALSFGS